MSSNCCATFAEFPPFKLVTRRPSSFACVKTYKHICIVSVGSRQDSPQQNKALFHFANTLIDMLWHENAGYPSFQNESQSRTRSACCDIKRFSGKNTTVIFPRLFFWCNNAAIWKISDLPPPISRWITRSRGDLLHIASSACSCLCSHHARPSADKHDLLKVKSS